MLVPDEGTAEFVRDKASDVDVFVDDDLRNIVAANAEKFDDTPDGERAERAELRRLMSWRRVHAMHGLLDAGYTAVFIELDVVFAGIHERVERAPHQSRRRRGSDYGRGTRRHANTKVLVAKPTASAKALFAEWQAPRRTKRCVVGRREPSAPTSCARSCVKEGKGEVLARWSRFWTRPRWRVTCRTQRMIWMTLVTTTALVVSARAGPRARSSAPS